MSIANESGNGTTKQPNSASTTSFSDYHNSDEARSKLHTLRGDDGVGCRCERCQNGDTERTIDLREGTGANTEADDYNDKRSFDNDTPTDAATQIPYYAGNVSRYNKEEGLKEKNPQYHNRAEKYERLNDLNKGCLDPDLSLKNRYMDKRRTIYTIADQIGIEGPFINEATELLLSTDLRSAGRKENLMKFALAALSYTHNKYFHGMFDEDYIKTENKNLGGEDGGSSIEWHTYKLPLDGDSPVPIQQLDTFKSLLDDVDLSYTELHNLQGKIGEQDNDED